MEDKYTEVEKEWFHAYMEFVNNRQMATGREILLSALLSVQARGCKDERWEQVYEY